MELNNPSIIFSFGSDLATGHSTTQTIGSQWILKNSLSIERTYLNGLKSASDILQVTLLKGCPVVEDILSTEQNIKAVVKDGATPIYTGYVSNQFSWSVNTWGQRDFQIKVEGVGTRLLKKTFLDEGYTFFNCSFQEALEAVCDVAEVTVGAETFPDVDVMREVEAGTTCEDLLTSLCYEAGYAYVFDARGELQLVSLSVDSLQGAVLLDSTRIYSKGSEAITVSKRARQYKGASITYTKLASKTGVVIYSAQDVTLPGNGYYDGASIHEDNDYTAPYVEAVNALSDSAIGSGKIVSISNVTIEVDTSSTHLFHEITFSGGRYFQLMSRNTSSQQMTYRSFRVKADVVYEQSAEVIRTSADGEVLKDTLLWVHDAETATRTANLIGQYNLYCGLTYTFLSKDNLPCGTICHIVEPLSSLNVYVMVTGSSWYDSTDIVRYKAVGVSVFDLERETTSGGVAPGKVSAAASIVQYAVIPSSSSFASAQAFGYDSGHVYGFTADTAYGIDWEWTDGQIDPATVTSGMYVWMRVSTDGGNTWRYSRLTGQKAPEKVYHGGISSVDDIPGNLSEGDTHSFLWIGASGATVGTTSLVKNVPYYWNGSTQSWIRYNGIDSDNASLMLAMLKDADGTVSDDGVYAWFQNLIVQNAVIQNLFSEAITLCRTGVIESEDYEDTLEGFKIEANGGATFSSALINGESVFKGRFDCGVIKTQNQADTEHVVTTTTNSKSQAKNLYTQLKNLGLAKNGVYDCSIESAPAIKFMRFTGTSSSDWSSSAEAYTVEFLDSNMNILDVGTHLTCSSSSGASNYKYLYYGHGEKFGVTVLSEGKWVTGGFTMTITRGNSRLVMSNLPDEGSKGSLPSGAVYRNSSTGALYIKI